MTDTLPLSPLTHAEVTYRRHAALRRAGLAMVTAHRNPHARDWHVDSAAEHVAEYDALMAASQARQAVSA